MVRRMLIDARIAYAAHELHRCAGSGVVNGLSKCREHDLKYLVSAWKILQDFLSATGLLAYNEAKILCCFET